MARREILAEKREGDLITRTVKTTYGNTCEGFYDIVKEEIYKVEQRPDYEYCVSGGGYGSITEVEKFISQRRLE